MVVCEQGNGELTASIGKAGQRDFTRKRVFMASVFDAEAHKARIDHVASQICVTNGGTLSGGKADDPLTDSNFRADTRFRKSPAGNCEQVLFFLIGDQNEAVVISEERGEPVEPRCQQSIEIAAGGEPLRERIQASQMIWEALHCFQWQVARHGQAVENLKDVSSLQREDVRHSDLRGNCVEMDAEALKHGPFGQRGLVRKVELKLAERCGLNQKHLGLGVFEQVFSRFVEELEREGDVI